MDTPLWAGSAAAWQVDSVASSFLPRLTPLHPAWGSEGARPRAPALGGRGAQACRRLLLGGALSRAPSGTEGAQVAGPEGGDGPAPGRFGAENGLL